MSEDYVAATAAQRLARRRREKARNISERRAAFPLAELEREPLSRGRLVSEAASYTSAMRPSERAGSWSTTSSWSWIDRAVLRRELERDPPTYLSDLRPVTSTRQLAASAAGMSKWVSR